MITKQDTANGLTTEISQRLSQWLKSQRIAMAARMLRAWSGTRRPVLHYAEAFESLGLLLSDLNFDDPSSLTLLSASALRAMLRLNPSQMPAPFHRPRFYDHYRHAVSDALEMLFSPEESIHAKSVALAHQLMHGTGSAIRVARFAHDLFLGSPWRILRSEPRLEEVTHDLRSTSAMWAKRLRAVMDLYELLPEGPEREHVVAILFANALCQPLLVVGDAAVTVPLGVDIDLHGDGESLRVSGSDVLTVDEPDQAGMTWRQHLFLARSAAVRLYRRTHAHLGPLAAQLRSATVTVDLSLASLIIEGVIPSAADGNAPLHVEGGSAGGAVSMWILAMLHGRIWYLSSAVSGGIGDRVEYASSPAGPKRKALDNYFKWVYGLGNKILTEWEAGERDRIVIPDHSESHAIVRKLSAQRYGQHPSHQSVYSPVPDIRFARTLSTVADIVQVAGWRSTTLIRCPDVEWRLFGMREGSSGALPRNHEQVRDVIDSLSYTPLTVVDLGEGSSPLGAASALSAINSDIRVTYGKYGPPSLSWLMVRRLPAEDDASFWFLIWNALGGSAEEYEVFRDAPTVEIAATRLAQVLNRTPSQLTDRGQRAPDIIIIAHSDHLNQMEDEREVSDDANPLSFRRLVDHLEHHRALDLARPRHRRRDVFDPRVGRARFILLRDSEVAAPAQPRIPKPGSDEYGLLQALSIFRFGFTLGMAQLLCRNTCFEGANLWDSLEEFKHQGQLREALGRYHLPVELRTALLGDRSQIDADLLADLHERAGLAHAPAIASVPVSAIAFDEAFSAVSLLEAGWQLREADRLRLRISNLEDSDRVRRRMQRLAKFIAIPSWGLVSRLTRGRHATFALETMDELMSGWQNHPDNHLKLPPHPFQYAQRIAARSYLDPSVPRNLELVEHDLAAGLAACGRFPQSADLARIRLLVNYAMYLNKAASFLPNLEEKLQSIDRQLDDQPHLLRNVKLRGDWFEERGDRAVDLSKAFSNYLDGTTTAPAWAQNWLKAIGTARMARTETLLQPVVQRLGELEYTARSGIFDGLERGHRALLEAIARHRDRPHRLPQLIRSAERWREGLQGLIDLFPREQAKQDVWRRMLIALERNVTAGHQKKTPPLVGGAVSRHQ